MFYFPCCNCNTFETNAIKYLILAKIARVYLVVPATSVLMEAILCALINPDFLPNNFEYLKLLKVNASTCN